MRPLRDLLAELRALREYMRTGNAPAWVYDRFARLRWTLTTIRLNRPIQRRMP